MLLLLPMSVLSCSNSEYSLSESQIRCCMLAHMFNFLIPTTSTRHFCHDLELHGGDTISSPVDSIVSLVSPKKSYGPNSVGKIYFSATPFSLLAKNATGGHNA